MEENKVAIQEQAAASEQPGALQQAAEAVTGKSEESFETLDYVKELFLYTVEQKKADKKKIRLLRTLVVLFAVIALTLVYAVFAAGPYLQSIVNDVNEITQKIVTIDSDALVANAQALMADATITMKSAGETIDKLDVEALNAAVKELSAKVGEMDTKSLNSAIESLNAVVSTLANTWPFNRG